MLIRFSLAVDKEIPGVAAFATFIYFAGKPWTDFDGAGLVLPLIVSVTPVTSVYLSRRPFVFSAQICPPDQLRHLPAKTRVIEAPLPDDFKSLSEL
jgi:hypothetical protein